MPVIIEKCTQRPDWQKKCEAVGFHFHSMDGLYWNESRCYRFTAKQIDHLDDVTKELHHLAIAATEAIITSGDYQRYCIPENFIPMIVTSWCRKDPSLYGRMDISWNGHGHPKLLEYNADTPTSLLEASIVQWDWMMDCRPGADQFNSLHEKLIERWRSLAKPGELIHLTCQADALEDINTTEYLFRTAEEAGLHPQWIFIDEIGWESLDQRMVDTIDQTINKLFKLYPSEWLFDEDFATHINTSNMKLIEPAWKVITSSKAILVKLWEMFPNHPNLLPSYFSADQIAEDYVRKPVFSREGANIQSCVKGSISETEGSYHGPFIYQAYHQLPKFNDCYTLIGSWIVGDEPAGIGIREDSTPITRNTSCFVPHYFKD